MCSNVGGGSGAKVLGKVQMNNKMVDVYSQLPNGWKTENVMTAPLEYKFITNGISPIQNVRGETKGKRKTGLIKDKSVWNDKTAKGKIRPIQYTLF